MRMLNTKCMLTVLTVLILTISFQCTELDTLKKYGLLRQKRIINGAKAKKDTAPYHVMVIRIIPIPEVKILWCGGNLISINYVLTAAHCLQTILRKVSVVLGGPEYDPNDINESTVIVCTELIVPESFRSNLFVDDIGLVKLPSPAPLRDNIGIVGLPTVYDSHLRDYNLETGQVCGKGRIRQQVPFGEGPLSPTLLCTNVTVVNTDCVNYGLMVVTPKILCVRGWGYNVGKVGGGDSGGGLIIEGTLVGIASFIYDSQNVLYSPIAFTRVASYLTWIAQNTDLSIE